MSERIEDAKTPLGEAELTGKATGEAPGIEAKSSPLEAPAEEPYVLAQARIMVLPNDAEGIYTIELFSGLRYTYDLRRYRELAGPDAASKFMVKMFSSQIFDAMSISGVPTKRLFGKAGDHGR